MSGPLPTHPPLLHPQTSPLLLPYCLHLLWYLGYLWGLGAVGHLVHHVHHIPPLFFLKADCFCEPPFWRHKSLRPLEEYHDERAVVIAGPVEESPNTGGEGDDDDAEGTDFSDEDNNNGDIGTHQHDSSTFEEAMTANIDLILNMAASLKHQIQFQDQWLLNTLQ
ncbi:hypothetical protein BGW80DRAFT_1446333 [Lactifluus volemus]|nr:hypothetical protein BGW80DRAFT_1446333 [Lactifluus volemus]